MSEDNWSRWGEADEIGAPNLIGRAQVLRAVAAVARGTVVSLAQPSGKAGGVPPHRGRGARFMNRDAGDYALGARSVGGFRFAEDTVLISTHSGTHVDALSHVWEGDQLYNGHPASSVRSTTGAAVLGAEKLASAVTRGILVDLVTARGAALAPSEEVRAAELEAAYEQAGARPEAGDAVLVRTGWWEALGGHADYFDSEPGIGGEAARWLASHDVSYVGADNYAVEVQPSSPGTMFPVHLTLLHRHGVPLIENMDLSGLSGHRGPFLFVLAPVGFAGSTAAQVTPLAVL